MIRIVFVESSLELVPKSIVEHPAVKADARRRKKNPREIILDDSKHHSAMKNLYAFKKRGRPDIVHTCILSALDSAIEDLELYVHTFSDHIIRIDRDTRIPRNYNRFIGLMEDVFKNRVISVGGKRLIEIVDKTLRDVLNGRVVVMKEGEPLNNLLSSFIYDKLTVCIGAFPHGDFEKRTYEVFNSVNAVYAGFGNKAMTSLFVVNRVLCLYEMNKLNKLNVN